MAQHLNNLLRKAKVFHDVFVGGGSVLLWAAEKHPDLELHANDLNPDVAAFWSVVCDAAMVKRLCRNLDVRPTLEMFDRVKNSTPRTPVGQAFKALFINRTSHCGYGQGPQGGRKRRNPEEIHSRYNVPRLRRQIQNAHRLLVGRCHVHCGDAESYVLSVPRNEPLFLDPPYINKGNLCYAKAMRYPHHIWLAEVLLKRRRWPMTTDDCIESRMLYSNFKVIPVTYSSVGRRASNKKTTELIVMPGGRSRTFDVVYEAFTKP